MIGIRDLRMEYPHGRPFEIGELSFARGQITSVIGRNGCGKTTLLKTIAGMLPYKGSIRIGDKESRDYRRRERARRISFLPQIVRPAAMDVRTLAEHGRFPWQGEHRRLTAEDGRLVDEALEMTGMDRLQDRELTELSGGELRRAYLAMAIAQHADMMLLDEPTTYMDIRSQSLFYEIVKRLAAGQTGIVMTCHHLEQSFSCSDRIAVMEDRTIVRAGTPEAVAADRDLLRHVFGASPVHSEDEDLLYSYVLTK